MEEQAADKERLHGKAQEEETEEKKPAKKVSQGKNYLPGQLSLFTEPEEDYSEVIAALRSVEISRMTPLEALNRLYALQEMLK